MLISHEYPHKNPNSSPRYILSPSHAKSNARLVFKEPESFHNLSMKYQSNFQNTRDHVNNHSFVSSAKGLSHVLQDVRTPSHLRSLSPLRQESKILEGINKGAYKAYLDSSLNSNLEQQSPKKKQDSSMQNMSIRTLVRKTKLTAKQKIAGALDESRKKRLNMAQLKDFFEKYKIKCTAGHNNKAIDKCTNLLATETDPYILENLFPGKYASYVGPSANTNTEHSKSPKSSLAHLVLGKTESLDVSIHHPSHISFLPTIRSRKFKTTLESPIDSRLHTDGQLADSRASIFDNNKLSAMSSIFGKTKWKALPQMESESFRDSLSFYQDFMHKTVFLLIEAVAKEASLEVGFCELVWDDSKQGNCLHMPKFFVQRVLKKMGHLVPVTISVIDYLFKTYNVEKISTDILPGNEVMCEALSLAGLKFEKVIYRNETKWQIFTVRKKDFYNWFKDVVPGGDNISQTNLPVKMSGC